MKSTRAFRTRVAAPVAVILIYSLGGRATAQQPTRPPANVDLTRPVVGRGGTDCVPPGCYETKVDKEAAPLPGSVGPRFPDLLRAANVPGEVLAQFVVDTMGRVDTTTFRALRTTHDLFTVAVRAALWNMRFSPAEVGGRKVKQLVQMPFQFNLTPESPAARTKPPV